MQNSLITSRRSLPSSSLAVPKETTTPDVGEPRKSPLQGVSKFLSTFVRKDESVEQMVTDAAKLLVKGLFHTGKTVVENPFDAGHELKRDIFQAVADGGASVGLNPVRLIQAQRVFYQATSSVRDKSGKVSGPPEYMEKLFRGGPPKLSSGAIAGGPLLSDWLADLESDHPGRIHKTILSAMVSACRRREIGQHLSGSMALYSTRTHSSKKVRGTTLEFISRQLDSVSPQTGDQLPATLRLYARYVDMKSFCSELAPHLEKTKPGTHRVWEKAVDRLTPNWSGGEGTFGHRADPVRVGKVYSDLRDLSSKDDSDFADVVIGLEKTVLAEEQTFWLKLLREGAPSKRAELLGNLARSWASLSVTSDPEPGPRLKKYRDTDRVVLNDTYNRAEELGSVVEHTLRALIGPERENFRQTLLDQMKARAGALQSQDDAVKLTMEKAGKLSGYPGLEVGKLLDEKATADEVVPSLSRLYLASTGEDAQPCILFPGQELLSDEERQTMRRHLNVVGFLFSQKERFAPRDVSALADHPELQDRPVILGPYSDVEAVDEQMLTVKPREKTGFVLGSGSHLEPASPMSIVLEGGGGKGFAYASSLRKLYSTLESSPRNFKIDEFCGTSAGAITASLLAAGYTPDELGAIMQSDIQFASFFSDHHQLTTGDDPAVGGVQRAGLFTTREMEKTIERLLATKLGIYGRPVTFADLPFNLKVPSTLVAGNAPPEVLEMLRYDPKNGRAVFGNETTPNMSVAAAVSASGAFPLAFEPPRLEIARPVRDESGEVRVERYWIQCTDGGAMDNLPTSLAGTPGEDKAGVILPSHYSDGEKGGKSCSTLDFDSSDLGFLEPLHHEFFQRTGPGMVQFLAATTADNPSKRVVITFDLREGKENDRPAVVGQSAAETRALHQLAGHTGFQISSEEETEKILSENTEKGFGARLGVLAASTGIQATRLLTEAGALRELREKSGPGLMDRPAENSVELVGFLLEAVYDASIHQEERRFQKIGPDVRE